MNGFEPDRRAHPWRWVIALGGALALQSCWFGVLEYAPPSARGPESTPPSLLWINLDAPEAWTHWRAASAWRAPDLFALPHIYGFSRHRLQDRVSMRPPVDRPAPGDLALSWSAYQAFTRASQSDPIRVDRPTLPPTNLPLPPVDRALPVPEPPSPGTAIPRIRTIPALEKRPIEHLHWPEGAAYWGTAAWTAEVVLRVDEQGVVTEALLDRRTPDDAINERLLQVLYGWRWAVGDRVESVRISIGYAGMPEEEAP